MGKNKRVGPQEDKIWTSVCDDMREKCANGETGADAHILSESASSLAT